MSGILAIGEHEREHIAIAIAAARKKPTPWARMKELVVDDRENPTDTLNLDERQQDNKIAALRREYPSQRVQLGTYEAALSFEEQPAGMMKHLSVASRLPGKVPGPQVMQMICEAFGFDEKLCIAMGNPQAAFTPTRAARVWVEEFEPGHHAINVLELEP